MLKRLKKISAICISTLMIGSTMIPILAQDNINQKTIDPNEYYKGFNVIEFSKKTGNTPSEIEIKSNGGNESDIRNNVVINKNLPQTLNGNYPEDEAYGAKIEYLYDPSSFKGFDRDFDLRETIDDTIYYKFKGGFRGNNIYIPKETYKKNENMSVSIKYPNSIRKTTYVKDSSGNYIKKTEVCDAKITLDAFIYLKSKTADYDGILISTSNNFFSGIRPKNISNFRLKLEMLDKNGKPINVEEVKDDNGKVYKGQTYFTVGSLNAYEYTNDATGNKWASDHKSEDISPTRKFGEGVAMLNPAEGTNVYLTNNTNVSPVSFKSATSDPLMQKLYPDNIIKDLKWNTYFDNLNIDFYRGIKDDFIDTLGSADFQKNAVSFQLKQANSYSFLLGNYSDRIIKGSSDKDSNTYFSDMGWNFFMSTPIFKQKDDDFDKPYKTVSDDDEQNVVENWHNSSTIPMTYSVSHKVKTMSGDTMNFYNKYMLSDALPDEVSFVSAKVLCDGKEFTDNVKYDKNKHLVYWDADKSEMGYSETKTIITDEGKEIKVPVINPGTMKMDGETYTLQIQVKIKPEALEKGQAFINRGQVNFDNNTLTTNKVITHPAVEDVPTISKDVEGKDSKVSSIDEENLFNLKVKIPKDIVNYKKLEISDILDKRLDYMDNSTNAKTISNDSTETNYNDIGINFNKSNREITVNAKDFSKLKGQKFLNISFKAKLNSTTEPNAEVPNKAVIGYESLKGVEGVKDSNTVYVISKRHTDPNIRKDVDGKDFGIYKVGEKFHYNVNVELTKNVQDYESMTIVDKLDKRLDLSMSNKEPNVTIISDGTEYKNASVKYDSKSRELRIDINNLKELKGSKLLTATIESSINNTAQKGEKIPNKATLNFTVPGSNTDTKESNIVNVQTDQDVNTPSDLVKDINGKHHLDTVIGKEFNYNVNVDLPNNAETYKKFIFTDKLDNRLDYINNSATVKASGKTNESFKIDFNKKQNSLSATIDKGSMDTLKGKKKLTLSFKAKLNDKAENGSDVPNTSMLNFINSTDFADSLTSNKVTVSAKDTNKVPTISKTINNDLDSLDTKVNDKFAYNLKIKLPKNIYTYKSFKVQDILDSRIDYEGFKDLTVDNMEILASSGKPEGNLDIVKDKNNPISFDEKTRTVNLEVPTDKIINLKDKKEMVLSFYAKANKEDNKIPNVGSIITKNSMDKIQTSDSNQVVVNTKEEPNKDFDLVKTVNGKDSVEMKKGDIAEFKLSTKLPDDIQKYKKFIVKDQLDERLDVTNDPFQITSNGKELSADDFKLSMKNQLITIEIKNIKAISKNLDVTFKAQLSDYDDMKTGDKIKNVYTVDYTDPNDNDSSKDSNEVNVDVNNDFNPNKPDNNKPNDNKSDNSNPVNNKSNNQDVGKGEAKIKTGDISNTKKIAVGILVVAICIGTVAFVIKKKKA